MFNFNRPNRCIVIVLMFSLLIAFGCTKEEKVDIKIGMIVPLTGWSAEFGNHERVSGEVAVEKVNQEGGIHGRQVKLLVQDSKSDTKEGINIFNQLLATEKVKFFFVESSGVSLALAPAAQENKIMTMCIAANPELNEASSYAFRNFPDAGYEAEKIATYAIDKLQAKTLALFYLNNDYGLGFKEPFTSSVEKKGGKVVVTDSYEGSEKDFRSQLTKIINMNPDAIYFIGYGSSLGLAIKQTRELKFQGKILVVSSVAYEDVFSVAPEAMEGVLYADIPFDLDSMNPEVKYFIERYKAKYQKNPSPLASQSYDGIMMMLEGIKQVGYDSTKVRDWLLQQGTYKGITGNLKIETNRNIFYNLVLKTIKDGQPKVISQ